MYKFILAAGRFLQKQRMSEVVVRIVLILQLGQSPKVIMYRETLGEFGPCMNCMVMVCITVCIVEFWIPKGFMRMEIQL